jgi:3-hydroxy-D-aspartate aldolase
MPSGKTQIDQAARSVQLTIDAIEARGLDCRVVGGTGIYAFEGRSKPWTELRCGSYIFMDGEYAAIDGRDGRQYADFEQSLFVLSSVMSVAGQNCAVVDAGLKSYTLEKGLPTIHGEISAKMVAASDEHGTLALGPGVHPPLGIKLKLVPSHCDPTVNLHGAFVCVRNDQVEAIWPISAPGAGT